MSFRRFVLTAFFLFALTPLMSGTAGAATSPDEQWTLPFEPRIIDHDASTGMTIVESWVSATEERFLHGIDLTGSVKWSFSFAADSSTEMHGIVVGDGVLYLATGPLTGDSTLRAIATDTGAVVDQWALDGSVRTLRLTDRLWFTYADYVNFRWTDDTIGSMDLTTGAINPAIITDADHDVVLVDVASDSSYIIGTAAYQTIRWDLTGPSPVETHRGAELALTLSNDDLQAFVPNGDRLDVIDPADLAVTSTVQGEPNDFGTIHELADGRLVSIRSGPRQEPLIVLLGDNGDILGRALSARPGASATATVIGDRVAYTEQSSREIRLHTLTPGLDLSNIGTIEDGQTFAFTATGDFLASVESVTIDGRPVLNSVEPAKRPENRYFQSAFITIEGGPLTAGSHTLEVDGSLGSAASTFVVEDGPDRRRWEVTLRPDSTGSDVMVWMHCHHPDDDRNTADVSAQNIELTRGAKVEIEPIPGHTCRLQAERRDTETPGWEWHLTAGFYDPSIDSTGTSAIDLETAQTVFTMPDQDVGISLFLPGFDEQVLWTYAYGAGTPTPGKRIVQLDCPDSTDNRSYPIYYGNWTRNLVPRDLPCLIIHRTPDGSLGSGFGSLEPNGSGRFNPPNGPSETTYYGAGQSTSLVVIYDVYPHPSEHNGAFARQQYLDFLGRQGDSGGLRFWEDALNSGSRQRTDLVQLFLDSPEFGGTVAPLNRLYLAYFDRAPDREGLFFWVNWLREGRTLGQVSDEFARSAEFTRTYGSLSDEDFIDLVYQSILGRQPDAGGRAFWINRIAAGVTRGQLMANFSESPEYIEQTSAAVTVESLYQGLLQRSPDRSGFAYWVGVAESGEPVTNLIAGMLSSDEYFNRFDDIYEAPPAGSARATLVTHAD